MNLSIGCRARKGFSARSLLFGGALVMSAGCSVLQTPSAAIPPVYPEPTASVDPRPGSTLENKAPEPPVPAAESKTDSSITRTSVSVISPEPPSIPPPANILPIDLSTALRLAEVENPYIGEARAHVGEALALLMQARLELVPTLNGGFNYDGHTGPLQRSSGEILQVSRQAVYVGGGAKAEAAGPPAVPAVFLLNHLVDGLYDPLAAHQRLEQVQQNARATANEVLGEVAEYYLELQGALALLEARKRSQADAAEVFRVTSQYARVGQGSQADAHRAETELKLRQGEIREAEEAIAVASARLCRRLHLDPSVGLQAVGDPLMIFPLINLETPVEELVSSAVENRPEVQAGAAGIAEAETRAFQEKARPLLPTVFMGFSGAAFGGGSNLVPPLVGNFRGRTDFDVAAFWSLLNFGLGNVAQIKRRQVMVAEAAGVRSLAVNRVRDEVASARAQALAQSERIEIARGEMLDALDGFAKDLERTKNAVNDVRPIELTNNMNFLKKAREEYIAAIIGYNQAQFRLFVALGSPPPLEPPTAPAPVSLADLGGDYRHEETRTTSPAEAPKLASAEPVDRVVRPASVRPQVQALSASEALSAIDAAHALAVEASRHYQEARDQLETALEEGGDIASASARLDEAHRASVSAEADFTRALDLARNGRATTPAAHESPEPLDAIQRVSTTAPSPGPTEGASSP